jgi:hypothetical protein
MWYSIIAQITNNSDCKSANDLACIPESPATIDQLRKLMQISFGSIALLAVIIIIIAGINFIMSGGDPQKIAKAKKAVIYACVGLAIAISAEIFVTFVVGRI